MKAACLTHKAGAETLIVGDLQPPAPKLGEVLVRVHAAGITPSELDWYPTFHLATGEARPFPIVPGHEFSGIIVAMGADVAGFQAGDAVYGLNDWFSNGAQAEYVVAPGAMLARKPETLDHAHAAAVPISALTAWQALNEKTGLRGGERILIHGAAGGVGQFAVQMAREVGAYIIATASRASTEFVLSLGANEVIDYRTTRFEEVARGMDVVFDAVGAETLERSWQVLRPGGRLVTIAASSAGSAEPRVHDAFMLVRADGAQLAEISRRIDAGELRVSVSGVFPLEEVRRAWQPAPSGARLGKAVLWINQPGTAC